ncbi:MAG: hypothetical protein NC390_01090 [Fusobacterium sp.]|nr:hypothetical protein [Fusobacterium sp.]
MAEILLSLTIIGVVAAITLPSLTGNINERTWNTQRKALYARMSQAIALMPALNGYGTFSTATASSAAVDNAAETFITAGLAKVLKINNICSAGSTTDCGIVSQIVTLNGSTVSTPTTMRQLNTKMVTHAATSDYPAFTIENTSAAAFETGNGESILAFYNPDCQADMKETTNYYMQPKICVNFIYDLNGSKGPNTVGKDIGFMTVFYPTDSNVVAPVVPVQRATREATQQEALSVCKEQDPEYRIPNLDELSSLFLNQLLIEGNVTNDSDHHWSSSLVDSTSGWTQGFNTGVRFIMNRSSRYSVRCVKR